MTKKVLAVALVALFALVGVSAAHAQTVDTTASSSSSMSSSMPSSMASTTTTGSTDTTGANRTGDTTGAGTGSVTGSASGTMTSPGLPNTGAGGNAGANIAILLASGIVALGGLSFLSARRYVR